MGWIVTLMLEILCSVKHLLAFCHFPLFRRPQYWSNSPTSLITEILFVHLHNVHQEREAWLSQVKAWITPERESCSRKSSPTIAWSVGAFRWRPNNEVQSVGSADCPWFTVAEVQLLCKKISSRAKQWTEILPKSQQGQVHYPNQRKCDFSIKVKCVTTL